MHENRKRFLSSIDITPENCVTFRIQDGNTLVSVGENDKGRGMHDIGDGIVADGIFTDRKGIFLFLVFADCLPMILFDANGHLALVHSSWKSTEARIAEKAVKKFCNDFKVGPEGICIAIGPAIHRESFKFPDPIQKRLPGWEPFLEKDKDGETHIDLIEYNVAQFLQSGVERQNLFISEVDTAGDERFFSHFRDSLAFPDKEGRFCCVVGIR